MPRRSPKSILKRLHRHLRHHSPVEQHINAADLLSLFYLRSHPYRAAG